MALVNEARHLSIVSSEGFVRQTMAKNILVTGATGKQGGAVISALLASPSSANFVIYAVTRDAASSAAKSLASKSNVEIVEGNLDDPAALFQSAGVPIWGIFSVQTFMGSGQSTATEQRQGIQLIDAAIAHGGVQQFVYASADRGGGRSSSDPTNIPHFISKYHIEKCLEEKAPQANMGYTILRPVAFMENLTNDFPGMNQQSDNSDMCMVTLNAVTRNLRKQERMCWMCAKSPVRMSGE